MNNYIEAPEISTNKLSVEVIHAVRNDIIKAVYEMIDSPNFKITTVDPFLFHFRMHKDLLDKEFDIIKKVFEVMSTHDLDISSFRYRHRELWDSDENVMCMFVDAILR